MTILVLAPPDDETARRFRTFIEDSGHRVVVPDGFGEVAITVTADRNAVARVELTVAGAPVQGVFHRGMQPPESGDDNSAASEAAFVYSESLAVWWSALALWPGPVVNRPSPSGFIPLLDPLTVQLPGTTLPPSSIASIGIPPVPPCVPGPGERLNVHRVRDGMFLGHGIAAMSGSGAEVLRFTCFDPERTRHILLAGDEEFDLSGPSHVLPDADRARLTPLLDRLRSLGADFALVVVQPEREQLRLLDISCHPVHHQFAHLEQSVFQALLSRILGGPP